MNGEIVLPCRLAAPLKAIFLHLSSAVYHRPRPDYIKLSCND